MLAELGNIQRRLEPTTPEGVRNAIFARTGDLELAERAKGDAWAAEKVAELSRQQPVGR